MAKKRSFADFVSKFLPNETILVSSNQSVTTSSSPSSSSSLLRVANVNNGGSFKSLLTDYIKSPKVYHSATDKEQSRVKLALLFIIINDFPLEDIWREWLLGSGQQDVLLLFHAKEPHRVSSDWVRQRLINNSTTSPKKPASWASIELSKTMFVLLQAALDDPSTTNFTFLSESCIPVFSFQECLNMLSKDKRSWIKVSSKSSNNGYSATGQFIPLEKQVPIQCVVKSDQWVMLTRKHALQVVNWSRDCGIDDQDVAANVNSDRMWTVFAQVRPSDEMFIGTSLCIAHGGELVDDEVNKVQRVTYCEWQGSSPHPETFHRIEPKAMVLARGSHSLFMRKVKPSLPVTEQSRRLLVDDWKSIVSPVPAPAPVPSRTTSQERDVSETEHGSS